MMIRRYRFLKSLIPLFLGLIVASPVPLTAEPLDQQLDRIASRPLSEVSPTEWIAMIQTGFETGDLIRLSGLVDNYLRLSPDSPPDLFLWSARMAQRVGQMRQAASRYKRYLELVETGPDTGKAAAELFEILVDYLDDVDDAYNSVQQYTAFSLPVRANGRHHFWMVERATERNDYEVLLGSLTTLMRVPMSEEQRRFIGWPFLADLQTRALRTPDAVAAARAGLPPLAGAIRDPRWKSRMEVLHAFLDYRSLALATPENGEDAVDPAPALNRLFRTLGNAQGRLNNGEDLFEWFGTLYRVPITFDLDPWRQAEAAEALRAHFKTAFERLPESEKRRFLELLFAAHAAMPGQLASPEGWTRLMLDHADIFTDAPVLARIPFAFPADREELGRMAAITRRADSVRAAAVSALASSSRHDRMVRTLLEREAWRMAGSDVLPVMVNHVQAYLQNREDWSSAMVHPLRYEAYVSMFEQSVWARFRVDDVRTFLASAWTVSDDPGKTRLREALQLIGWVPWNEEERARVFDALARQMEGWESGLEDEAVPADEKEAARQTIALYRSLQAGELLEPDEPLPALLQALDMAVQKGNQSEYNRVGEAVIEAMLKLDASQRLGSEAIWHWLTRGEVGVLDPFALRLALLGELLKEGAPPAWATPARKRAALESIGQTEGWTVRSGVFTPPQESRERALQVFALFEETLLRQIEAGRVSPAVLAFAEDLAVGEGWDDRVERMSPLIRKIIATGILRQSDFDPGLHQTVTTWEMLQVAARYRPTLSDEFPTSDWFDDRMARDIREAEHLELAHYDRYHRYGGRDSDNRIAAEFMRHLSGWETYPFDDRELGYRIPLSASNTLHDRIIRQAPEGIDDWLGLLRQWGGKTRFDSPGAGLAVLNRYSAVTEPALADREPFLADLRRYLAFAESHPRPVPAPRMSALARWVSSEGGELTRAEVQALHRLYRVVPPQTIPRREGHEVLIPALLEAHAQSGDWTAWTELVPRAWRVGNRDSVLLDALVGLARKAVEEDDHARAALLGVAGSELLAPGRAEGFEADLARIRSEALIGIGALVPVPPGHPDHGAFSAQASYLSGVLDRAWMQSRQHRDRIWKIARELDPSFLVWIVEEKLRHEELDAAQTAVRFLIPLFDEVSDRVPHEVAARLALSGAEVPVRRREYDRARAQLRRLLSESAWEQTRAYEMAKLRLTDVERLSRNTQEARMDLERYTREGSAFLRTEAFHRLALLLIELEEYAEAERALRQVFLRNPHHAQARILEGQLNLLTARFVEATEIAIGFAEAQRSIVPGRNLRIRLEDDNLAVVGVAQAIDVRVWTSTGDEEVVRLLPIGDSRTRFDVQVPTGLAAPKPGDGVLQVLGTCRVYYDFTPAFKEANNIVSEPAEVSVASNATLLVSSGEILTEGELELRLIEEQLRSEAGTMTATAALSLERPPDQIRPGGLINVRVDDPVRSVSGVPDSIDVLVSSQFGEERRLTLRETGATTGVFEGSLPTDRAPPRAFASDTEPGFFAAAILDPDPAVAWLGRLDSQRPKWVGVDFQDRVEVGSIAMRTGEAGRKVMAWDLEVWQPGRGYQPIASWPRTLEPWDGAPRLHLAGQARGRDPLNSAAAIGEHLQSGWVHQGQALFRLPFDRSESILSLVRERRSELNLSASTDMIAGMIEGGIHIPATGTVTIRMRAEGRSEEVFLSLRNEEVRQLASPSRGVRVFQVTQTYTEGVVPFELRFFSRWIRDLSFEWEWDLGQPGNFVPIPAEYMDPDTYPQIRALLAVDPALATAAEDASRFEVHFENPAEIRGFRFLLLEFEGDAPIVNSLSVRGEDGQPLAILSPEAMSRDEGGVLRIAPGDTVTVGYEDAINLSGTTRHLERQLLATYHDASINGAFSRYLEDSRGEVSEVLVPARRYLPGDGLNIVIFDPDADTSPEREEVAFEVITESGERLEGIARESGPHTGTFFSRIFPVLSGDDPRPYSIRVQEGEPIILRYMDTWNTDPGVPVLRSTIVEQAFPSRPELRVFAAERTPVEGEIPPPDLHHGAGEYFPRVKDLRLIRPVENQADAPVAVNLDAPIWVEVLFPYAARAEDDEIEIFLQTESAREAHRQGEDQFSRFDLSVPGTIRLQSHPSSRPRVSGWPFFRNIGVDHPLAAVDALDVGRFTFEVPWTPGEVPSASLVDREMVADAESNRLYLPGGDRIRVGFRYKDEAGAEQWETLVLVPESDAFLDVMDRNYRERLESARVGDRVYLRLVHRELGGPSPESPVLVGVRREDGQVYEFAIAETVPHSGLFRLPVQLTFEEEMRNGERGSLATELPVRHGETITFFYRDPIEESIVAEYSMTLPMGVDVDMDAFTKQFGDDQRAVDTLFTMAEAHYEIARRHRELDQQGAARRHIEQGRRILSEGMRSLGETANRDQSQYLLANLALELASMAENGELRDTYFQEALSRFNEVVSLHADSTYAPMAQYRKGILYERLGEMDRASEEFVRLSYRYPDSPLVGETIVRLGRYFLGRAQAYQAAAEGETDNVQAEWNRRRAREEYTTSAEVFSRLSIRFPEHALALRADLLAGQSYLRAERDNEAMRQFERVIGESGADPRVRAEALYWLGDLHARNRRFLEAYRTFTEITWDYPESEWARFARGRLAEPAISNAGQQN